LAAYDHATSRLRTVLRVGGEFAAAFAPCGVAFLAVRDGAACDLVRWDIRHGHLEPLSRIEGAVRALGADAEGARVVAYAGDRVCVHDGARGHLLWERTVERRLDDLEELLLAGDEVIACSHVAGILADGEPDGYAMVRIAPAPAPLEVNTEYARTVPGWYAPPARTAAAFDVFTNASTRAEQLAVSRDGTRVATELRAWTRPAGKTLAMPALQWNIPGWWVHAPSEYTARDLAWGEHGLLRVSAHHPHWIVEDCDAPAPDRALPRDTQLAALVPGTSRAVVALVRSVHLRPLDGEDGGRVLLPNVDARALACADDGSAIAVAFANRLAMFDGAGEKRDVRPLHGVEALAVARGGAAVACRDGARLAISRGGSVVHGPADDALAFAPVWSQRSIAFSPDGAVVAYPTAAWGVALVDADTGALRAELGGLTSPVSAVAFAHDGDAVFAACADGRVVEWDLPR
ncbi:MAG: hypothetical protein KIT31_43505, partial [Deltaproteobacteria bacterium]|nr:hypothetical protein [Deltaproteobacteria bacterium]